MPRTRLLNCSACPWRLVTSRRSRSKETARSYSLVFFAAQPQVPGGQVGPGLDHAREQAAAFQPLIVGVAFQAEVDDHVIGGLGHRRGIAVAVPSGGPRVEDRLRETEHQPRVPQFAR